MNTHDELKQDLDRVGSGGSVFTLWSWDRITMAGIHSLGRAATLGDDLIVGVVADDAYTTATGWQPLIDAADRREIIDGLRLVSDTVVITSTELADPELLVQRLAVEGVTCVAVGLASGDDRLACGFETALATVAIDAGIPVRVIPLFAASAEPDGAPSAGFGAQGAAA